MDANDPLVSDPPQSEVPRWECDRNTIVAVIPAAVPFLDKWSFSRGKDVEEVRFEPVSKVVRFRSATFSFCMSLRSICIPRSITILHSCVFIDPNMDRFCYLETVIFEPASKLRTIKPYAFAGCFLLKLITLPASVRNVTGLSFSECGLVHIDIAKGNQTLSVDKDFVMREKHWLIRYFGTGSEVSVPDEIASLSEGVFEYGSFGAVAFGSTPQFPTIPDHAFGFCSGLSSIAIPSSVTILCESCFQSCHSLQMVSFSADSKLRIIGGNAFSDCVLLESISVPSSVELLCPACFCHCCELRDFHFLADSKLVRIEEMAFDQCSSLQSLVFPCSLESIGARCFREADFLSVLVFSSPCRLRELLDLPPKWYGIQDIPDSVEILSFSRGIDRNSPPNFLNERRGERTLTFGRESRLMEFRFNPYHYRQLYTFFQVTSRTLKLFRKNLEFGGT
jgi:hypothetical protein